MLTLFCIDGLGKDVDMTLLIGNADNFADSGYV